MKKGPILTPIPIHPIFAPSWRIWALGFTFEFRTHSGTVGNREKVSKQTAGSFTRSPEKKFRRTFRAAGLWSAAGYARAPKFARVECPDPCGSDNRPRRPARTSGRRGCTACSERHTAAHSRPSPTAGRRSSPRMAAGSPVRKERSFRAARA